MKDKQYISPIIAIFEDVNVADILTGSSLSIIKEEANSEVGAGAKANIIDLEWDDPVDFPQE